MGSVIEALKRVHGDESGHAVAGVTSLVAGIGAIVLGYGAAGENDLFTIGGGFVLGVGIFLAGVARHRGIDYEIYSRLEALEGKK